jgi:hypothetical protein
VAERRIQPYLEQQAAEERRSRQLFAFRRNQALGLVLFAALTCLWWLLHTNSAWIFPTGWWRL